MASRSSPPVGGACRPRNCSQVVPVGAISPVPPTTVKHSSAGCNRSLDPVKLPEAVYTASQQYVPTALSLVVADEVALLLVPSTAVSPIAPPTWVQVALGSHSLNTTLPVGLPVAGDTSVTVAVSVALVP